MGESELSKDDLRFPRGRSEVRAEDALSGGYNVFELLQALLEEQRRTNALLEQLLNK
jgi:hypothetical protein